VSVSSRESELDLPSLGSRRNLRQNVADALRGALITGQMAPGELYSAPKLAQEFGVSPTPVREAMLDLVSEGLVEAVRNKGFRVVRLNPAELDELAEIRRLLEPPIMARVARAVPEHPELAERIEQLRPTAQQIVETASQQDFLHYIELDTRFHLDFLALHGNARLVAQVRDLRGRSRLFGLAEMSAGGTLVPLAEEHEQMVDAGLAGDGPRMQQLVDQHIDHVRKEWAGAARSA
jgi:DNA-binding GntR family transcriptional regulator